MKKYIFRPRPRKSAERRLKDDVDEFLATLSPENWYGWKVPGGVMKKGKLDYIGAYLGVPVAIELKAPGQKLTLLQQAERDAAERARVRTCVVYAIVDLVKFFSEIAREAP